MTTTGLITGATTGIGRATADKPAQSGVHVMVVGRNVERGEKAIAEIRATGGKADFVSSDLRDAASARAVARKAVELGGGHVDILINNVGISVRPDARNERGVADFEPGIGIAMSIRSGVRASDTVIGDEQPATLNLRPGCE
jgi:short-subunit dehydrogenase